MSRPRFFLGAIGCLALMASSAEAQQQMATSRDHVPYSMRIAVNSVSPDHRLSGYIYLAADPCPRDTVAFNINVPFANVKDVEEAKAKASDQISGFEKAIDDAAKGCRK